MSDDKYTNRFMGGESIRYQTKLRASQSRHAILLLPALLLSLALWRLSGVTHSPMILLGIVPVFVALAFLSVVFSVLRVTVTTTHMHVQFGMTGPRIPLDRIQKCEAVRFDWKTYVGGGVRIGLDGSTGYIVRGNDARAVRVVWRDEAGSDNVTVISVSDPDAVVAAVARAQAHVGPRVAATPLVTEGVGETAVAEEEGSELAARRSSSRDP